MSDEKKNQVTDQSATQPIKKTSAVPLRKETVRVTLKAPGAKPGIAPSPASPPAPSIPATKPLAVAPTPSPLKQETMRVTLKADKDNNAPGAPATPPPAPTIPLGRSASAAPPALAAPAPTMKLGGSPTVPLATQPLNAPAGGASSSQQLPKATVELQQTQQLTQGLGAPTLAASIQTVSEGDEATRGGSGALLPMTIVAFVLSLVVLWFQFSHAKIWIDEHKEGDVMSIFEGTDE